ncbi:LysE family translocator [Bosea sp. NBC_00550]|uniref:LysE family translocator n=1 Tax=Bosea sp. NBC_00550 TaxID=2969621 RepID=UPI00222F63EB|nr:LysE family translocator [Bosea sp. NBC_00550]UZF95687.1 LysE family translocator [Bosea sp. NBC_00550]
MPETSVLILFVFASLALIMTPGPDMALTLTRGVTQGFRAAALSVAGSWASGLVQIPIVVLGLAAVFQQSPLLFAAVKFAGAIYLGYLGGRALWRCYRPPNPTALQRASSPKAIFWQGFFTNLLNPKVFLFITAFLPQFADPVTGPIWLQLLILASISKTLGFIVSLALAGGASKIRGWLAKNGWFQRVQEGVLGFVMLSIAMTLIFGRDGPRPVTVG